MSVNATLAVAESLVTTLRACQTLTDFLGGQRVYDTVPVGANPPYVTIARMETRDWSTQSQRGHEHLITLNAWSSHDGRREVLAIIGIIDACLDNGALVLDGHKLINLRTVFWNTERSADGRAQRATMRLRVVSEPQPATHGDQP